MLGYDHWLDNPPFVANNPEFAHPAPPGSYAEVKADRLGAWYLFVFLRGLGLTEDTAWANATDWGGDRFGIFDDGVNIAAVWRIRYQAAAPSAAVETAEAVNRADRSLRAFQNGSDVYIIGTEDNSSDWTGM